ncbi:MAG: menaquinone-dependent protoporphyrinogen oxidase [Solirubrobacteraceae bacterium]|nr:menaquinone-dependent protoporphyrinogen oxidase [Solirubrobacteraceae bacterium]
MPKILILYASTHGHTAKIAARIAATLEHDGATVDLHQLGTKATEPAPADFDAVILGASIHVGHHQRAMVNWAERHHTALGLIPSAFFSVCLTAADDTEEARATTRGYLDGFVEQTGWTPGRSTTFAGAVQYREYDLATRVLMRLLMRRMHHATDASQDHDYTDWDAVERWAHELAATLTPAVVQA